MPLTQDTVGLLLKHAGLKPTDEQIEATTKLHNTLEEQLTKAPAESLAQVEPHYIQPTRRERRRQQR